MGSRQHRLQTACHAAIKCRAYTWLSDEHVRVCLAVYSRAFDTGHWARSYSNAAANARQEALPVTA